MTSDTGTNQWLKHFSEVGQVVPVIAGDVLLREGEAVTNLLCVHRGILQLSKVSELGRVCVVDVVGPGGVIGEEGLELGKDAAFSVGAVTESSVLRIPIAAVRRSYEDSKAVRVLLNQAVLRTRLRICARLMECQTMSTEQRLAKLLMQLATPLPDGLAGSINPRLSHERLAELLGTTRPRVTVFMNRLKRQGGLAEKGSGLLVFPALATLAESGGNRRRANEAPDHLGRLLASVAAGTPVTSGSECV